MRQTLQCPLIEARQIVDVTIAVSDEVHHAALKRDDRLGVEERVGDFELAHDGSEPLVAFAPRVTCLGRTFQRAMHDRSKVAELRDTKLASIESPGLRVRLTQREEILAFAFPARRARELLEAALPGFVELDEQLRAHVARYISQPRQLGAQLRQLVDLIERRVVSTFVGERESPWSRCSCAMFHRNRSADSHASSC